MFKICVFLVAFVGAAVADGNVPHMMKMQQFAVECAKDNDVDIKTVEAIAKGPKGEKPDLKLFEENKNYRCFAKCMILKAEMINDDAVPQMDKIQAMFQLPEGHQVLTDIKTCAEGVTDTDSCDKAYKIQTCIMEKLHDKQ